MFGPQIPGSMPKQPTQQGVDRRRQLAEALMRVGQQGTGLSGPWGAVASLLAGGVAGYQQSKAEKEQGAVNEDWSRKMAEALIAQGGDPKAIETAKLLPIEQQRVLLGQVAASKLGPKPVSTRAPVVVTGADGKPRYANAEDAVGQQPYEEPKLPPGMRIGASGQPEYIPEYLAGQERIRKSGASSTTVNLPETKYPNAFQEALGKADAARLDSYQKSAEGSTGMLKTLTELERLNPTALEGGGAQARAQVANFLKGFTGVDITDPKVLADTQQYNAIVAKSVLDSLGGSLGAGVSNADVSFIQNTVPKLEYSREARQQLIDYLKERSVENVKRYQRARSYGEEKGSLKGFDDVSASFPGADPAPGADIESLVEKYRSRR